jgi:threonine aldolase
LVGHVLDGVQGVLDPSAVERAVTASNVPGTSLLALENTHTRAGGVAITDAHTRALADVAHRHGARVHLDGARLLNAAAALGVDVCELTAPVDTVALSLNKGAGAPLGALLAGSAEVVERARLNLRRIGGASIHQAGLFAAAGIVALDGGLATAREDNAVAAELADRLVRIPGLAVDAPGIRTNIVTVDVAALDLDAAMFVRLLMARGVRAYPRARTRVRFAVHRGIGLPEVLRVAEAIGSIRCQATSE